MSREHSPLKIAEDAVILDTTDLSVEKQIEIVYELAMEKIEKLI